MLVTSGNVTTYAAEQTDESVEVDETPENENLDAETQMEDSDFIIEDDESQDEVKTPDLYMEEEENHRIPLRGIGIALAIAASLALVLYCLEEWRVLFRQ